MSVKWRQYYTARCLSGQRMGHRPAARLAMSLTNNNAGFVIGLVLFACAVSLIVLANFLFYVMIGRINLKLPENERVGYFGFFSKNFRVLNEYRHLYPSSPLYICFFILFGAAMVLLVACAWQLGFFNFSHLKPYRPNSPGTNPSAGL